MNERFLRNITQEAKNGKLDNIIGRENEIRHAMQILCRRLKNNPVLIGKPGVGKTAIVEGLAQRIISGDVPGILAGCSIYSLDIGFLLAGAKFMGEFEERLKSVIDKIEKDPNSILFIDEVHTIVGAGKSQGAMDASNMLKPALARGNLRCIGATTIDEYKEYIEKDPALARRFQPIFVNEPTQSEALAILRGLKESYELHHGVQILDESLVMAVQLSRRYITERFLPDKALDIIDEACSNMRMVIDTEPENLHRKKRLLMQKQMEVRTIERSDNESRFLGTLKSDIESLEEEIDKLNLQWQDEKRVLVNLRNAKQKLRDLKQEQYNLQIAGNFDRAAEVNHVQIPALQREIDSLGIESAKLTSRDSVGEDEVAEVVSRWTGIPVSKMLREEKERLLTMESELNRRVIGQDHAIELICKAIRRSRSGLFAHERPIGVFMCVGPTGVGKTELSKALAEFLFDDENAMIRIDMSEYSEDHTISRLIGAPPGYIGYDKGGVLTDAVRIRPYQVVLLDEIEKASPRIWNLFLQIFDDGRATDGQGHIVNFKETIFMMTSNIGTKDIRDYNNFSFKDELVIQKAVMKTFPPEFINRLDEIIVFHPLKQANIERILHANIQKLNKDLKDKNIIIQLSERMKSYIVNHGYVPEMGARPMKRMLVKLVHDPLTNYVLQNQNIRDTVLMVDEKDDTGIISQPLKN